MKRTLFAIALLVASTFVTSSALAQDHRVKATVPFDFTVNGTVAPAGTYTISAPMGEDVLYVTSWDKKVHFLASGIADWNKPDKANVLVFHKYGDQYYLSEIRCHDTLMNVYFPPSKAELKAKGQTQESGIPINSDIVVALN
jgi:hypothetical protein